MCFIKTTEARHKVFTTGCIQAMLKKAEDNLYIIGGVAVAVALPQVITIII